MPLRALLGCVLCLGLAQPPAHAQTEGGEAAPTTGGTPVQAGAWVTNLYTVPVDEYKFEIPATLTPQFGASVGAWVEAAISKRWSVSTGFGYAYRPYVWTPSPETEIKMVGESYQVPLIFTLHLSDYRQRDGLRAQVGVGLGYDELRYRSQKRVANCDGASADVAASPQSRAVPYAILGIGYGTSWMDKMGIEVNAQWQQGLLLQSATTVRGTTCAGDAYSAATAPLMGQVGLQIKVRLVKFVDEGLPELEDLEAVPVEEVEPPMEE